MRTLTDVFGPGAAPLPEGLRTLVVMPDRSVEPGMTVNATFAFYNMGGAPATGLRVRFSLPDGLRYLVGSARIDDLPLEETGGETGLLSSYGAEIGEVPPGAERRISLSYLVAPTIENGAIIELQAAIASVEISAIGSNVVRLVARSVPELHNASTSAAIEPVGEAEPGEEVRVIGHVYNSGQSSAHDVIVVLPIPDYTTYVAGSARIDGRPVSVEEHEDPFGFAHAPLAATSLAPGATLVVEYRARVDFPLPDGTVLFVEGAVASAEIQEFALPRGELTIRAATRFDGDETALVLSSEGEIEAGERVRVAVVARNTGTCDAQDVRVRIDLPAGLRYANGSRSVDLRPVGEADEPGLFVFERIPADQRIEAALEAYAAAPAQDGMRLPVLASVAWPTGTRTLERTPVIRARPRFLEARNTIELASAPTAKPEETVAFVATVVNDGTTTANDAVLALHADPGLQALHYRIGDDEERRVEGPLELGTLEPLRPYAITVRAHVGSPIADRTPLRLGATLTTAEVARVLLGHVAVVVRSRSRFSPNGSRMALVSDEPLRPDQATDVLVRVENEGTDVARDVRLTLRVSSEAHIESVEGAARDGSTLNFGDVAAGAVAEATVRVCLAPFVERGSTIIVEGRLSGTDLLPFALHPVRIPTEAQPDFRSGATLVTAPEDSIESGAPLGLTLTLRNSGDGAARRLIVYVPPVANTAYVPGSTIVNDVPIQDIGGGSILWYGDGLALEDIAPGVEVVVRWSTIVNTPLRIGTLIEARAEIDWDGHARHEVVAEPLRVRSAPAFTLPAGGLPFTVAGVAARREPSAGRETPPSRAPRVSAPSEAPPELPLAEPEAPADAAVEAAAPVPEAPPPPPSGPTATLDLPAERLARTLRYLEQADFQGFIAHFFALRAFFPDAIHGLAPDGVQPRLEAAREALRMTLDRLLIKLRLPRYTMTAKDLEDGGSRTALRDLLESISEAPLAGGPPPAAGLRIAGAIDRGALAASIPALEAAPLGSPVPWLAMVPLIGTTIESGSARSEVIGEYRDALGAALKNVSLLPLPEFHRVLVSSSNPALDKALRNVMRMLREAPDPRASV